jgi:hypothetical protein
VGAYFEHLKQLYGQVQLTKGCEFGLMSCKTLALKGLENGSYHEVLGPWVTKVLAGQHKIKVDSSSLDAIQSAATNILVTSRFYQDHTIQLGKLPARARAADSRPTPSSPSPPPTGSDPMLESIVDRMRKGEFLSRLQARWMRDTYPCIHCFSKSHGTESCIKLSNLYTVTKHPGGEGSAPAPPSRHVPPPKGILRGNHPVPGGAVGRKAATEGAEGTTPAVHKPPGEEALVVTTVTINEEDDNVSVANGSDDAFAMFETLATTDEDLLHSIAQIQARRSSASGQPLPTASVPVPISTRKHQTHAKMAKTDLKWIESEMEGKGVRWDSDIAQAFNVLANQSPIYEHTANHTLCPDSGATSNMCPYRDMFVDYQDIHLERQYVRLGDENKRILIHGRGTLCMEVDGRKLAYADTLHVPQLSAILLST